MYSVYFSLLLPSLQEQNYPRSFNSKIASPPCATDNKPVASQISIIFLKVYGVIDPQGIPRDV